MWTGLYLIATAFFGYFGSDFQRTGKWDLGMSLFAIGLFGLFLITISYGINLIINN